MSLSNLRAAELFKQMAAKAGFTDDQVNLALNADEFKELQNRDNRHSEYSSALDKVKNLEPLANKAKDWDDWWNKGGKALYEAEANSRQALTRYQERFGQLDPNDQTDVRRAATATGLTMEQTQTMIQQALNEQGVRFSQMSNELLAVTVDAQSRGIVLTGDDVLAMNKLMAEQGVTYAGAYERHVGPRIREQETQKQQKDREDYANQKVQDELARRGISGAMPIDTGLSSSFIERPANGAAEKPKSDQELIAMWNEAGKALATR